MIYVQVKDYCQDCPDFIADVETNVLETTEGKYVDRRVFCVDEKRCESMYKRLKREMDSHSKQPL